MGELDSPEIVVDLRAIRHNLTVLAEAVSPAAVLCVVKADGYGHGMVPVARAAREAGVAWLGAATLPEALELRAAGDTGRILTWLHLPGDDFAAAAAAGLDVTAYSVDELDRMAAAGPLRVQLKLDTGLSRGGAARPDWAALIQRAADLQRRGAITVTGVWSHFACSDEPDHPANGAQERAFREGLELAREAGLDPEVVHLANSAGALLRPSARFDLVRIGLASYGLDPAPAVPASTIRDLGLRPAMTVRTPVVMGKDLPAGSGVSYGHHWVAEADTHVVLVPLGYADGIPRAASNRATVLLGGTRRPVRGTICMDQFVVEGPGGTGDDAVLWGPGDHGEPTAQDWAEAAGTISYEIVTRVGGRARRRWIGEEDR